MVFDYRQALLEKLSDKRGKKFRSYKSITETLRKHGIVPPSQPTIMTWSRKGWFPPAYDLSSRIIAWDEREVLAWVKAKEQAPLVRRYFKASV